MRAANMGVIDGAQRIGLLPVEPYPKVISPGSQPALRGELQPRRGCLQRQMIRPIDADAFACGIGADADGAGHALPQRHDHRFRRQLDRSGRHYLQRLLQIDCQLHLLARHLGGQRHAEQAIAAQGRKIGQEGIADRRVGCHAQRNAHHRIATGRAGHGNERRTDGAQRNILGLPRLQGDLEHRLAARRHIGGLDPSRRGKAGAQQQRRVDLGQLALQPVPECGRMGGIKLPLGIFDSPARRD